MPPKGDSRYWSHEAEGRAQRGQRLESGQGLLPRARAEEDRPRRVLRRCRAVRPAAPSPASLPHEALPERRRPRLLPPEAGAGEPSAVRRRAIRRVSERPLDRLRRRRQRGRACMGRQPGLRRAAHVAFARARHRAARLSPDRPRPDLRRAVATRAEDRPCRQGGDGRARIEELSQDVGVDRAPRSRADQAGARIPGSAAAGEGDGAGDRAQDRGPGGCDDDVEGRRPARRVRRLRPERARPDDRVRVLDSSDSRRAGFCAARLGRSARRSSRSGSR